ncbi:MAG TPA: alpha/beta hydrolase [Chitinophagales bacterium]|nr:alpha/beta hydrolase [Chitinophagales bacterium]
MKLSVITLIIIAYLTSGHYVTYAGVSDFFPPATTYNYAVINGHKIFYREAGDKAKPTIVLLHGYPSSSHTYRNLIPILAQKYHVIAPDNLGSGYSDHVSPDSITYTFDMLADCNLKLLETLGVKNYIMYMQDFGAPVGYRLIMKEPARLKALIVQNANTYMEGLTLKRQEFFKNAHEDKTPQNIARLFNNSSKEAIVTNQYLFDIDTSKRNIMSPDAWTHDLHFLEDSNSRRIQVQLFQDYYNNLLLYPTWQKMLKQNQPKTLIVWGARDVKFLPEGANAYLRDLPDAELHLLDAGHFAAEEKTSEIAGLILKFLEKQHLSKNTE